MTRLDLIEMECTSCKNIIFGDKNADYWYCGICGKRIDIKMSAELQEKENKLKAKESELKIRENALRKKEAELKEKEEIIKALENGEELIKPKAPVTPTFKATQTADGAVPTLVRPDTVLNNPEMKFTNLASDANKKPATTTPVTPVAPTPAKPVTSVTPAPVKPVTPVTPAPVKLVTPVAPAPVKPAEPVKPELKPELPKTDTEVPTLQNKKPKAPTPATDGKPKEFEMNEHTLVKYNTLNPNIVKVNLPANIWRIGSGAFRGNTNITSVVCSDNVKEICDSAFMDCTSLMEVTLSNEIRKINFKTFNGCEKLKSITIPESVKEIMCDSMVCGLEEIVFKSARTTWEQASDAADASFAIDKNGNGKGVSRFIFRGVEYKAVDVFKHGCLTNYFKANGLCQYCGSKFSFVNGKCPNCKTKKDY
ncbi:MAG: leucine-rich repeat protein [Ruminococcus sp.]|nr:leucine-rich repeat protein [Ruminococcus sp.]